MSQDHDDRDELSDWGRAIDNLLLELREPVKYLLCPPLYLYGGVEDSWGCIRRARWLYVTYFLLTIPLFWEQLMAGNYLVLATFPVFHLVVGSALIATVAPMVLAGVPLDWPAALAVPAYFPDAPILTVLALGPVAVGLYGLYRVSWVVGDDQMVVPMTETEETSEGASKRPLFERAVSTLLIGETGAGKSAAMKLLAYQREYATDVATFAHDLKRDFSEFFTHETDMTVERIGVEDSTVIWNLFLDVEKPRQFTEVAKGVMGEEQGNDPFHKPATQVLADAMILLHRRGTDEGEMPTHADLLTFLEQGGEDVYRALDDAGLSSASSLDPETGGHMNVYDTMMVEVRDVFVGDFAKAGNFSLREYVENPAGRAVTFDTPVDEIETVGPMFRLMLDLSIKYGMTSDTEVNYLLDEVDQLPRLSRLSSLASAGRGMGVRALIGIQTVGQLRATYEAKLNGILGNCPQGIYFAPGESSTVEYVLDEVGELRETVVSETESTSKNPRGRRSSSSTTERETDRTPITSGRLKQFEPGDCVVKTRSDWWVGKVEELEDVRENLDDVKAARD